MNFIKFRNLITKQIDTMIAAGPVFSTTAPKDGLYETYLLAYRPEDNPIKVERTEHDCNCCKSFIRKIGGMVGYIDGQLVSVWDVKSDDEGYQIVADKMAEYVKGFEISTVFLSDDFHVGKELTKSITESGFDTYNHFYTVLPKSLVNNVDRGKVRGEAVDNFNSLRRAITEIHPDHTEVVYDLIHEGMIERHPEYKPHIIVLKRVQEEYAAADDKTQYLWLESIKLGKMCTLRNTPIGQLLQNLTGGDELDVAVSKYEKMVSGENFKRSKTLYSPAQKARAGKRIQELGLEDALHRTHAVQENISINDISFVDRSVKESLGILDVLSDNLPSASAQDLKDVQEVSIEHFMNTILPKATSIEMLVENRHVSNLVTLVAPKYANASSLLQWDNGYSWAYNGDFADTVLRRRVGELGGRVDGAVRFSHTWNEDGQNQSLMDLHMFYPGSDKTFDGKCGDRYGNSDRVGWNNRKHIRSGGVQDVDFVNPPGTSVPVENITVPSLDNMPDGIYRLAVHNWDLRRPTTSGFRAEVEVNGELRQYNHPKPLSYKEWVRVADLVKKGNHIEIVDRLDSGSTSQDVWNVKTTNFVKVNMAMLSPNFWGGQEIGNKHYFFVLEGCKNPDPVRGYYNEFLRKDLIPERKVFEALGAQTKAPYSDNQLSGLGFPSTKRDSVICKVRGSFNRTIKINF